MSKPVRSGFVVSCGLIAAMFSLHTSSSYISYALKVDISLAFSERKIYLGLCSIYNITSIKPGGSHMPQEVFHASNLHAKSRYHLSGRSQELWQCFDLHALWMHPGSQTGHHVIVSQWVARGCANMYGYTTEAGQFSRGVYMPQPLVPLTESGGSFPSTNLSVSSRTNRSRSIISAQFWISPISLSFLVLVSANFCHCALCLDRTAVCFASSFSCFFMASELAWRSAARVRISESTELPTEASEAVTAARASAVCRDDSESVDMV